MSRKTKNIYAELESLESLAQQIKEIDSNNRELDNIHFEMSQRIKSLRFWIDSLYSYNGKSTSNAKKASSKENGKKGGRPPKKITESRRRITEIQEILLPQINHNLKMTDDFELESKLKNEILSLEQEIKECSVIVQQWEQSKSLVESSQEEK